MDGNKAREAAEDAVAHASNAGDPRDICNGAGQVAIASALLYVGNEIERVCGAIEAIGRDSGALRVLTERAAS